MDVLINAVHFTISSQLEEFTQKKVSKLSKYSEKITTAEVFYRVEKPETNGNKQAELKLAIPGHDVFAHKHADSFEAALDACVEAVKKQLEKIKEK